MIAKTYGIYDSIQKEYVQTFTAKNDEDAQRTAAQIVRTPQFDDKTYNDRSIHHLFDIDTSTGQVVDNTIRQVFNFSTAIAERKSEEMETLVKQKLLTDDFKNELKSFILSQIKEDFKNEKC